MTDRIKGVYVAFEEDVRTDDAEPLIAAIKQLRGVAAVKEHISTAEDWMNRERIRRELGQQLWAILYPTTK